IRNNKIEAIGPSLAVEGPTLIERPGLLLFPGLFDMQAFMGDPGFEDKEDLVSGLAAARAGGFTDVLLSPDTDPFIDNKGTINYIFKNAAAHGVNVHICGALS